MKSRSDCFVFHTVKIQAISSARFQSVLFFNLPLKVKVILICFWNVERFIHPPLNRVLPKRVVKKMDPIILNLAPFQLFWLKLKVYWSLFLTFSACNISAESASKIHSFLLGKTVVTGILSKIRFKLCSPSFLF